MLRLVAVTAFVVILNACSGSEPLAGPLVVEAVPTSSTSTTTTTPTDLAPLVGLELDLVAELDEPVAITSAPSIGAIFVVERTGRIVRIADGPPEVVLDITEQIGWEVSEQGLLGLALHPDFPDHPRGFVIYTNLDEDLVASSFDYTELAGFDVASERQLLTLDQPHFYHQGGGMAFGPDGYLWMSFGDGGGIGDRYQNGQNPNTLNGTIVRISVDTDESYAIPSTNPFALNDAGAGEVWAFGLRNPWRITIEGDLIIIADVGQNGSEEVNVSRLADAGKNFGWPVMEGTECFESESCDSTGMAPPALTVDHSNACALIGGPVYRGSAIPELYGHYVFGDFCFGWMRSAPVSNDGLGEVVDWEPMLGSIGNISTFGIDTTGELLVATLDGNLYRITAQR